jgi:hypothetical protein
MTYRPMVQWDVQHPDACIKKAQDCVGPSPLGYLYRFDWDQDYHKVMLTAYPIVKKTPKGWRIRTSGINPTETKFQIQDSRRKFAAPTIAAAKVSYQARKNYQRCIFQARADEAQRAYESIDDELGLTKKVLEYFLD